MNRMEEYEALLQETEELPPALEDAVGRARARARRRKLRRRISAPAGSVAAVFAVFVLMVNLWTPFALACARVPVLKELTAAVAFSPSLKAAVENDYVQYIGQSQTENGITVNLEYLMADQGGLMLFLSITGPEEATSFMPRVEFTTPDGEGLEGCSVHMSSVAPGELTNAITVAFKGEEEPQLPEALHMTCEVQAHIPGVTDHETWTADAVFTFDFPLDQRFRGQGRTVEVNRWIQLDGNDIRIVDLELYPTHARLNLEQAPDNAEELRGLNFYLEDGEGNRYEEGSASGLAAMGDSYLFESPYFSDPKHLTLYVTGADWVDKDLQYVTVNLDTLESGPLPEGVTIRGVTHEDDGTPVLHYRAPKTDVFSSVYTAPDGTQWSSRGGGYSEADEYVGNDEWITIEGMYDSYMFLTDYPWDTVTLELNWSHTTTFDAPVTLTIR